MGFMFLLFKKFGLLFLLISASLLSTSSFAGRHSRVVGNFEKQGRTANHHEEVTKDQFSHEEIVEIHDRILNVNTKDYGRYDPAPVLGKPPFKVVDAREMKHHRRVISPIGFGFEFRSVNSIPAVAYETVLGFTMYMY